MIKKILLLLAVVMVSTALAAPPCWACSCLPNDTKAKKAKRADVVFTGTVVSITDTDPSEVTAPFKVGFEVAKVYKGYPRETTNVYTAKQGSMCGMTFEVGEKYTVFALVQNGEKWVGNCGGTKKGTIDPDFWGLPKAYEPQSSES